MIQRERVRPLNNENEKSRDYVLYWMQSSQRSEYNHALEYAAGEANARAKPLVVFFGLTEKFPEANERHYAFMLEGLRETGRALEGRGVRFVIRQQSPDEGAIRMARRADLAVVDRGYLKVERRWRQEVARKIDCPLVQVETNVIAPLEQASPKEEYAARTIRPRIKRQLEKYLVPLKKIPLKKDAAKLEFKTLDLTDLDGLLARLPLDRGAGRVRTYIGGASEAKKRLREYIDRKLVLYAEKRNDPNVDAVSGMSPYLHFGQISPLEVALEVLKSGKRAAEAYLEELVVRRELSMNFVYYNNRYDRFEGLPDWARKTLKEHEKDEREALYSPGELEEARTADPYWNAAQREMVVTGKMHNYMRMYWGKRIIEWTKKPEDAFRIALHLNNKYELDGRDPNGFTGVAWCFGKHDRAWPTHPVLGKIRIMKASGLRRKFDADAYARKYEVSHG
ncbi:MAG: deoxyribodipyrimidine photo-lyase [Candidatus Aminicenantales bacterium]